MDLPAENPPGTRLCDPPPSPTESVESVPLHVLCENCERFAQACGESWDRWRESAHPTLPHERIEFTLGTKSQLLDRASVCHLCNMVVCNMVVAGFDSYETDLETVRCIIERYPSLIFVRILSRRGHASPLTIQPFQHQPIPNLSGHEALFMSSSLSYPAPLRWSHAPCHTRDNVPLVKEWLRTCLSVHKQCDAFQGAVCIPRKLPRRILDLSQNRVRLRCDPQPTPRTEYTTLSHMWGRNHSRQVRLVKDRLLEFQEEIQADTLSAIYKEAIRITRMLGYSWIWIDSLCIIQDSQQDWEEEAVNMATVYGNAACNLSFLQPPEDFEPAQRRDPRNWAPCILRQPTDVAEGLYIAEMKANFGRGNRKWLQSEDWPLLKRAWVFQERLLCARTAYCGIQNFVWECSEAYCDELLGPLSTNWISHPPKEIVTKRDLSLGMAPKVSKNSSAQHVDIDLLRTWVRLISSYKSKALSYEGDRVMAFASIAAAIHNIHGFTYLAGIWKELLLPSLLWATEIPWSPFPSSPSYIDYEMPENVLIKKLPTWSWFSTPSLEAIGITVFMFPYLNMNRFHNLDEYNERVNLSTAELVSFQRPSCAENVLPSTCFYDFAGLRIRLMLVTIPAFLEAPYVFSSRPKRDLRVPSQLQESDDSIKYWHDDATAVSRDKTLYPLEVKLAVIRGCKKSPFPGRDFYRSAGLALVPGDEPNTWRRVGMWKMALYKEEAHSDDESALLRPGWQKEELVLV